MSVVNMLRRLFRSQDGRKANFRVLQNLAPLCKRALAKLPCEYPLHFWPLGPIVLGWQIAVGKPYAPKKLCVELRFDAANRNVAVVARLVYAIEMCPTIQ